MPRQEDAGSGMAGLVAALFDEAPVGIARLDLDGVIVRCNSRLAGLLGHQPGMLVGGAFAEAFAAEDRGAVRARLARLAAGSVRRVTLDTARLLPAQQGGAMRAVHLAATAIADDGQPQPCGLLVHVLGGGEGDPPECSVPAQQMQVLGQLTGSIAHDFNNLIAAILGSCESALGEIRPGNPGHDDLAVIRTTALRARGLVGQLLAFVRKQPLRPMPLHLDRAIDGLLPLLRRLAGTAITIDVQHAAALPPVRIDSGQFDQVIVNLAVNARDAMPRGGRLSLRTEVVAGTAPAGCGDIVAPAEFCVLVEVVDTGSGIPRAIIGEIFAPLFTTKPAGQGTGLGLATVHGIVQQNGGRIEVDSSEGIGTTFRLLLPAVPCADGPCAEPPPPPDKPSPLPPSAAPRREARVLLVEDEGVIRSFAARALRSRGWSVAEAGDGSSAVQALHQPAQPCDLLLIDMKLPDMAGTEVIRQARLRHPDLPVVVISGELSAGEALDPADHRLSLLAKPFTLAELVARVHRLLER